MHCVTRACTSTRALQTEKFYDMVGSLTFTTLTATSLALSGSLTPRKARLCGAPCSVRAALRCTALESRAAPDRCARVLLP